MSSDLETFYGLPKDVVFCKKCTMSNQKPNSTAEFKHKKDSKKDTLLIGEDGICSACKIAEKKEDINWEEREAQLVSLLDKYRKNDGSYDCLIPGSGGKDSAYQAHILKYKYGMNPLTITWPPIMYTDYGRKNFQNWIDIGGFDNISYHRNGKVLKTLTRLSIENLFHPFQTFILGQMNLAPKIAAKFGIDLIFYGENPSEYGNNAKDDFTPYKSASYFSAETMDDVHLAGLPIRQIKEEYGIKTVDLMPYMPPTREELESSDIKVCYLGYFLKWIPQEAYYYAIENCGFQARPFRSQGTYSKYESIDDKIDDLHWYTLFLKFGIGRATYNSSQEVRNNHLTREEAVALVDRFDGEFPDRYFNEVMEWLEMKPDYFMELCDKFRSPHLWGKDSQGNWKLRHTVSGKGLDD